MRVCSDGGDPPVCQQVDGQTAVKREEILTRATTRVESEDMALGETSQARRGGPCTALRPRGACRSQIRRDREQVAPGQGRAGESPCNGDRVSVWEGDDVLEMTAVTGTAVWTPWTPPSCRLGDR